MLAWTPPEPAQMINPLADTMTLVRFLGGLKPTDFPAVASQPVDVSQGDVVFRDAAGALQMRWGLVFERLDPFVNNSIQPVIVLDNVPWCFVSKSAWPGPNNEATYGNNKGPDNVTEYGGFVKTLLEGIVARYTLPVVETFWFRVGTEPDTQPGMLKSENPPPPRICSRTLMGCFVLYPPPPPTPQSISNPSMRWPASRPLLLLTCALPMLSSHSEGHWNDTNAKFLDMYLAVSDAVVAVAPGAQLGPANFAADGPSRQASWDSVIIPIAKAIKAAGARVDYLAMSSYGRAIGCAEPTVTTVPKRGGQPQGSAVRPGGGGGDPLLPPTAATVSSDVLCEYSWQSAAETAARLADLRALWPATPDLPMQVMEYGGQ